MSTSETLAHEVKYCVSDLAACWTCHKHTTNRMPAEFPDFASEEGATCGCDTGQALEMEEPGGKARVDASGGPRARGGCQVCMHPATLQVWVRGKSGPAQGDHIWDP